MRIKTKLIAYLLTAAMVVTSAPANVTLVSAAGPASSGKKASNEAKNLVTWNQEYTDELNKSNSFDSVNYQISADGTELSETKTFIGSSYEMNNNIRSVDTENSTNKTDKDGDDIEDENGNYVYVSASTWDDNELRKLCKITDVASGSSVSYRAKYHYQWYTINDQGEKQELTGKTSSSLDLPDETLKNTDGERTYICEMSASSVGYSYMTSDDDYDDGTYYFSSYTNQDENPINYKLTYKYTVKYAGLTADDFGENGSVDASDLIAGLDGEDTVARYSDYEAYATNASGASIWSDDLDAGLYERRDLDDDEMPDNYQEGNVKYKYVWKAFNAEGKEVVLQDSEKRYSYNDGFSSDVPTLNNAITTNVFDGELDDVAYFQVDVDYYYGYIKLGSFTRKFQTEYAPFDVTPSLYEPTVKKIRDDSKVTLKVDSVRLLDSDVTYGFTYQWYKVSADGAEEKLDGETTNVLKTKVTDITDTYHCRLTAKVSAKYRDSLSYDKDVVFTFESKDGYLVKDISDQYNQLALNEELQLFIDAKADKNYKISYQWEKLTAEPATQEDEETGEEINGYEVKREVISSDNAITIKPESEKDFAGAPRNLEDGDFYPSNDSWEYNFANYALTVTTQKGDEEETVYTYYFRIGQKDIDIFTDSNDGTVVAERGEDVDLYAYSGETNGYKLEKKWYQEITTKQWKITTYRNPYSGDEEDEDSEIPADTEVCEDDQYANTDDYYIISDKDTVSWTGPNTKKDEEGNTITFWTKVYDATYYKELNAKEDGSVCTLAGKNGDSFNDDRLGHYMVEGKLYSSDDAAGPIKEETLNFDVTYESDLTIYAKNDEVQAAEGTKANLQVVAINKNKENYPISYQWAKKNDEGEFVDLPGKNYSVLSFDKVTADDYGTYCVTVTDPVYGGSTELKKEKSLLINLIPKAAKVVVYTPEKQKYNAAIGDTVSLKTNVDLEDGVKPFYAWYRSEHVAGIDATDDLYSAGEDPSKWELLNVDGSSYDLKIDSEDDYTTYLCEMSYLTMEGNTKISVTKRFYFTVEDGYYFDLQKLTPAVQKKKLDSSATYSVKILTDNPTVKEENVKYQWFTYDEDEERVDIDGANASTYTIDKITMKDFGTLYVEASIENMPEKYTVITSFRTENADNKASLDDSTNHKTLKAKVGDNITLMKPVIKDGDGYEWTYQWYYGDPDDGLKLYGATDPEYTIKNIGENEFGTYYCVVSCEDLELDWFSCTVEEDKDTSHIFAKADEKYVKQDAEGDTDGVVEAVLTRSATLGVTAVSNDNLELKYQWYKDGDAIGGATESTYQIAMVTPDSYGVYTCQVMDSNNRMVEVTIELKRTYELNKEQEDTYDPSDVIGYEVKLGDNLTLTAKATCAKEYTLYYEWYKYDKEEGYQVIEDQTTASLELTNIQKSDLGKYYCKAYVLNENGTKADVETLSFYYNVYVNTGLVVVPDLSTLLAEADGSVKMHVRAKANADQEIAYEWSKWTEDETDDNGEIDWEHPQDKENDKKPWNDVNGSDNTDQITTADVLSSGEYDDVDDDDDYDDDDDDDDVVTGEWKTIEGANSDTFTLPEIKNADYGTYRVVVYTSGEEFVYKFTLDAHYAVILDRGDADNTYSSYTNTSIGLSSDYVYAEEGDTVNVSAKIINPAVDMDYTYEWYAQQPVTGTMMKVNNEANASTITQTIPAVRENDYATSTEYDTDNKSFSGYSTVSYGVKIHAVKKDVAEENTSAAEKEKDADVVYGSQSAASVRVLAAVDYDNSKYPETDHPFKQRYNLKGFVLPNDGAYEITFSKDTDVDVDVIDDKGTAHDVYWKSFDEKDDEKGEYRVTVSGSKAIFYARNYNEDPTSYGYKVTAIKKIATADDAKTQTPGGSTGAAGAATPGAVTPTKAAVTAVKKGTKVTVGKLTYKVTKAAKKNGTVTLTGVKANAKKSLTKVTVPATIKIKGTVYKVTAINAKALSGLKKLKSVVIGKNVTKIGANAFNGDKKLKNISIKSKAVKSIGANAFKGVPAKAKVSVPAAKKKAYKKLIKKAGLKKAKIK